MPVKELPSLTKNCADTLTGLSLLRFRALILRASKNYKMKRIPGPTPSSVADRLVEHSWGCAVDPAPMRVHPTTAVTISDPVLTILFQLSGIIDTLCYIVSPFFDTN